MLIREYEIAYYTIKFHLFYFIPDVFPFPCNWYVTDMTHIRTIPVSTIHIPFPRHPKGFNPETLVCFQFPLFSFFLFCLFAFD